MINRIRHRLQVWRTRRRGAVRWYDTVVHFPPNSVVADHIIETGSWEGEITAALVAAAANGTNVFDVGANIGASAIPLLARHPSVRVVSIEPSPSALPYLTRNREGSRFRDRWEVVPKAATRVAGGEIAFWVHTGRGADVFEGLRNTGRGGEGTEIKVPTTTLDAEWAARGRPAVSLVKIDVEGGELAVLAGASECLAACRPIVATEWCVRNFVAYEHAATDVLDAADAAGYDVYVFPELTKVADRRVFPVQLATRENLLLVPKS